LDIARWTPVLAALTARHGRLGNDGEVCWILYAAIRLEIDLPLAAAADAVSNCGALTVVAILSAAQAGRIDPVIFERAWSLATGEDGSGRFWPLLLEWKVRNWPRHEELQVANDLLAELIEQGVWLFDATRLPAVFNDFGPDEFTEVEQAIEKRSSQYDDEDEDEDGLADDDFAGL
jgi:hypothetical protein